MRTSAQTRAVAAVIAATTVTVLPAFLTGAMAVQIRADLHLSSVSLGMAVGCFFAGSAIGSVPGGRVAERLGWQRAMAMAMVLSALALGAIAILAREWLVLAAILGIAGLGQALANPAANLALARSVRRPRLGVMFGVKQAAVPLATLVGGIAVPTLALTVGWRWAFAGACFTAITLLVALPRRSPSERASAWERHQITTPLRSLVVLSIGGGMGAGAAVALGAFTVVASAAAGLSHQAAALLLVLGSASALAMRLLNGWLADRHLRSPLQSVAMSLLAAACGYLLLATGSEALLVAGTVLAFGAGWGWNGLFHYAIVQHNPRAPAAASGVTQTGFFIGSALGPPLFGAVAELFSFQVAWLASALLAVLAAVFIEAGRRWMAAEAVGAVGALPASPDEAR